MALVKDTYTLANTFPAEEKFGLVSQIKRCSISIPSNIAEGWGRNSSGNFAHYLNISKGSLCELETQLILAVNLGYVQENETQPLMLNIEEISKMLKSLIDTIASSKT